VLLAIPGASWGQAPSSAVGTEALGTVTFPVSCSASAQAEFNRATALLHHMTYPQAREAYAQVAKTDPRCALAHWGIAMTLFQPLWPTRPSPEELRRGWGEVEQARDLVPATERERLFVDAAGAFFQAPDSADYWARIRRWELAMERLYTAFPQDPEATVFYALALLALPPSEPVSDRTHRERAATLLLSVYQQNPDHPGAMHYLVHADDAPGREHDSPEIIRKYAMIAPHNAHALHMPTHIYTRLGDWNAVIGGNLAAADAALETPAGDSGQYVWDEFPHAMEYLVYAYLQKGADDSALAQLGRLHGTERLQPTFKTAFHLASTSARYALERHAWSEARSLVPREPPALAWDRFPWAEAVTWFARGLGAAHEGKADEARAAVTRLAGLDTAATRSGEDLFARNIRILRLEVSAWLAQQERDTASSVVLLGEAVALELATPKHPVTPGPTLPAYELLGDLYMAQARPRDALVAYQHSLDLYPRRFNSLLGAARAARAAGSPPLARTLYGQLLEVAGGSNRMEVGEARAFVLR
jgi:tetratricopeptide (TPR) repeat protein